MLGPGLPSPLSLALYALAFLAAVLYLVRSASSRYFAVEDDDAAEPRRMSIGGGGGGGDNACSVCRSPTSKSCARCKSVFYCSQACQSKHWEKHKLQCKSAVSSDKANIVSSDSGTCRRRKSSGFGSVRLIPAGGNSKVLQEPKKILFPYDEFVKLFNWDGGFEPCGLTNCGNSCFANVVLQCLSSTRPLVAYLLQRDHSRDCIRRQNDWCFLCELQAHVRRASKSCVSFSPLNILSRLPNIGGNLGYGRQEDAHEFMRLAIDTMQSVCLDEFGGEKVLDPGTRETTLIHHIFDGRLQSQVKCTKCNIISNRYENMMDLTVEIQGDAESLEECLNQFTTVEWLDGENMYKCDGCNAYVKACKRLTVHQAPNILTIALKRFQTGRFGKLNKRITFPESLDLTPYMSGNGDGTDIYSLYAVVVHVDMLNASFFGHYICYTKNHCGHWYRIDDCKVTPVEVEEVLAQGAYMLLYSRKSARREPFIKPIEPARKKLIVGVDSTESKLFEAINPVGVDSLLSNVCSKPNLPLNEVPIDVSSHRDTGHERTPSIVTVATKENCLGDMDLGVPSTVLHDTYMDGSEPRSLGPEDLEEDESILSASAPEEISSVNYVGLSSVSVAEGPSTEAQDMDCHKPCISPDAVIITEQDTRSTQTTYGALKQPKYTSSVKNIDLDNTGISSNASVAITSSVLESDMSSDADFCASKDAESIVTTEFMLKDSFPSMNAVGTVDEASLSAARSSSGGSVTDPSPVLEPAVDSRTNLEQLVFTCTQSDSVNGAKDVSCRSKWTTTPAYCSENESSGKSKFPSSGGYLDRSAKEEQLAHNQVCSGCYGVDLSPKANGYINGHVECNMAEPDACNYDTYLKPHSVNKDSFPSSGLPSTSLGFLNNSPQQFMVKDKIAVPELDQIEHTKHRATYSDANMQLQSANDNNNHPGSGMPIFSRGFLDKSYRKSMNDAKITTNELERINRHCQAICNGSDVLDSAKPDVLNSAKQSVCDISAPAKLLSANGDASNGKASALFSPRGFLDRHYKKSVNEDRLAKKNLVRADKPCKIDCNGFNEVTSLPTKYGEHDISLNKLKEADPGSSLANGNSSFK